MTWSPVRLHSYDLALKRILRPPGVISSAPIVLIRWLCCRLVGIVGVCPRGAQVRLREQTSDCPFSSIKTRVARRSRHFFYPGPPIPFPVDDRGLVTLEGTPLRSLTTPPHPPQEIPHRAPTISNAKQTPDQLADTPQRPIIPCEPMSTGPLQQGLLQSLQLSRCQPTWTIGRVWILLPLVTQSQFFPSPALNTAGCHAHHGCNLCRGAPLFYQHKCSPPTCGKLLGCPNWSHALYDATELPIATLLIEQSVAKGMVLVPMCLLSPTVLAK